LVWILVGCGGLLLLFFISLAVAAMMGISFLHHVAKNPAAAVARAMIAANPNAELVSMDEDGGKVVVRDKRTGKTVTLNFEDLKQGRMSILGENGEKLTIGGQGESGVVKFQSPEGNATLGGGGPVKLPAWFPSYSSATPRSTFSLSDNTSESAGFQFTTADATDQVLSFYESGFKSAGLKVTTFRQADGGVVSAQDEDERRQATVTISTSGGATQVIGTFKSKR
jgi:hypothetical protein